VPSVELFPPSFPWGVPKEIGQNLVLTYISDVSKMFACLEDTYEHHGRLTNNDSRMVCALSVATIGRRRCQGGENLLLLRVLSSRHQTFLTSNSSNNTITTVLCNVQKSNRRMPGGIKIV
jgi:hypothetical protein